MDLVDEASRIRGEGGQNTELGYPRSQMLSWRMSGRYVAQKKVAQPEIKRGSLNQ